MTSRSPVRQFPLIEVHGGPYERGLAHGESLRERIRQTFCFYMDDLFAGSRLERSEITARAQLIQGLSDRYAPALTAEIQGIALASGLEAWQIFVLNARTEILNARVAECTALYFAESRLLAQNWDWVEPLEDLCVVIRHIHPDGHRHLSFCEPGMVAKIGLNNAGIGVCLNILFAPHDFSGLPVHLLIGALMAARSFTAAQSVLESCGLGKASNLLVADAQGSAVSMEYFGDERHALGLQDGVLMHTNHCIGKGTAGRLPDLGNSCGRYDRIARAVQDSPARDIAAVKDILLSEAGGEDALMRAYQPQTLLGTHRVGTCACIIMELAEGRMHIRRGPGSGDTFMSLSV
jgi:isopenicillin-N N-acyltransferase-like protein